MYKHSFHGALLVAVLTSAAQAQAPVRLKWTTGQVLTYRVEQSTHALEVIGENRSETKTRLNVTKRWQVADVDAKGVATLQLSLAALRIETTTPSGEALVFDSANPDKSTPQLRDQLSRYIGPALALVRVDSLGKVVEVKESKFGPASRYESEPPFVAVLPSDALTTGKEWQRAYQVTLEPPQGAGEKFAGLQQYVCKELADETATIEVRTEIKDLPEAVADQMPLLQSMPVGTILFDVKNGRLLSAALKSDRELKNHQGEGSSYRFVSSYTETLVTEK
jgi:hypothetical protein